jgi:hypothetical protein
MPTLTDLALNDEALKDMATEARLRAVEGGKELAAALNAYDHREDPAADQLDMVWDTRLAVAFTPEAVQLQLNGWEPLCADTAPRQNPDRSVSLDQVLHFRKRVLMVELVERGRKMMTQIMDSPNLSPLARPPGPLPPQHRR